MANNHQSAVFIARESIRDQKFNQVWNQELNEVFADVARYYDRANYIASLGLWNWFREQFLSIIEVEPRQNVLDVCAGTNAVGLALLDKQPSINVVAIDRSREMQAVGQQRAKQRGHTVESVIGDVHHLPFEDNYFDVVTLQFASRHLKIMEVIQEIRRVLKPGGTFYHSDMLRPNNYVVEQLYYNYLRVCLTVTAWLFRSSKAALNCRNYFINALQMFYSAEEFSEVLANEKFCEIESKVVFSGMLGFHKAVKPT